MSFLDDNPSKRRVCAVMCTYGRFEIVKQSLTMFLAQDYPNKQLVIFNTATTPLILDEFLMSHPDSKVVNQTHKSDGTPYKSLGCVRNASLEHAEGDIYICWDDDDLFMPWHITQAMSHWSKAPVVAWKPDVSYWSQDGGKSFLGLMGNSMEASFVVGMKHMKQYGFSTGRSGAEHVDGGWLDKTDALIENVSPFESYGYIWGDKRAGHKTSGHIGDGNNFENHKNASDDFGNEPLSICSVHMFDKFFKSAIAMWENPTLYEGINTQVTVSQVEELKGLMRDYYLRHAVELPEFLRDVQPQKVEDTITCPNCNHKFEASATSLPVSEKPATGRNNSFLKVLTVLEQSYNRPITIVEAGCIRKPNEEGRIGDGWSTVNWDWYARRTDSKVHVVDINKDHIAHGKSIVPESEFITYYLDDSVNFLKKFEGRIDLLFLDSFDYCGDEENQRACHYHSLNEVIAAWDKLSATCFVLIDDVFNGEWDGKGKLSIPYLLDNGFELMYHVDNQVLLRKG